MLGSFTKADPVATAPGSDTASQAGFLLFVQAIITKRLVEREMHTPSYPALSMYTFQIYCVVTSRNSVSLRALSRVTDARHEL
jgi:hypothetical protein